MVPIQVGWKPDLRTWRSFSSKWSQTLDIQFSFCGHSHSVGKKTKRGRIHGLIVERGMEGFTTLRPIIKWSLRASATGELIFDNVKVPKENLLTGEKVVLEHHWVVWILPVTG